MWFNRVYEFKDNFFQKGKVNLLYGPRRVGKTELIKKILSSYSNKTFVGEGDDIQLRRVLGSSDKQKILSAMRDYDVIFIDEAQRIKDIGWGLKILVDNLPEAIIIASGSSSFQLSSQVGSPLTGRVVTNKLYSISLGELRKDFGGMHLIQNLETFIIYGMYPEVIKANNNQNKAEYLIELRNSLLLKDILEIENIRNSDKLIDLLQLLAFQIGSEVSLNELGTSLGIAKQTVAKYLDLLEKIFIIKRIGGFSRNLRKEVAKSSRYYFYDNGIRNAVINNFNNLNLRNDTGMLWENFMVMERIKWQHYNNKFCNNYFWRTYDQKEIDLVEERDGKLFGYEFKWNPKKNKVVQEWLNTYKNSTYDVINNANFLEFF